MKKLIVCGKGNAAYFSLKYASEILSSKFQIIYVYRENELDILPDFGRNTVQLAGELDIESVAVKNSNDLLNVALAIDPSFIILAQFSIIVKEDLLMKYYDRVVNLHYGKLPEYRGVAPITHALLNKEKVCGVTLHYVDSGIDTGDIIKQNIFNVTSLTNEEAYKACEIEGSNLLIWFYNTLISRKKIQRYKQNDQKYRYYDKSSIDYSKTVIDLFSSSEDLIAFYYAFTFPSKNLYPKLLIDGKVFIITSVPKVLPDSPDFRDYSMGEIISFDSISATFKCRDAVMLVKLKES